MQNITAFDECLNEKIKQAEKNIFIAELELEQLKAQKEKTKRYIGRADIEQWIGNQFESSTGKTPEFMQFIRDIKKHLKGIAGLEYELIFSVGHFYFSGFFKNKATGKYAYFYSSDVRYFPDAWYNDLLVRTAQHDKDFTGGSNHFYRLPDLGDAIDELTA